MQTGRAGIAFAAILIGACLAASCSPAPSPSPQLVSTAAPTSVAQAAPSAAATPRPGPSIWCDPPQVGGAISYATPTCEAAVEAALEGLPSGHPDVVSVAFHYGFFCGPGKYCTAALPPLGHVIAMYGDGSGTVV